MMAWGPMEILMLMALGGGGQTADLASCLPADIYFRARNIPITAENMVQLASKKPDDGKAQIAQLLALRVLAEQPELVKKAANSAEIMATLEKIAKGEIAKDRLGFAEDYAARTLAALGGPRIRSEPTKQIDMREQTLDWFPELVTLVGAFDARDRTAGPEEGKAVRTLIAKFTKEKDWEKVFEVAEMVGNVRLERISFAYAEGKEAKDPGRLYVRIGGKADHQRVVEAVKKLSPGFPVQQTKDVKAVPLATMAPAEKGVPAIALIGDTDLVFATFVAPIGNPGERDDSDVLKQLLAVREGKEPSMLKAGGALKDGLAKISPNACGLVIGEVPEAMRKNAIPGPVPRSVRAELINVKDGLDLRTILTMSSPDDAKMLIQHLAMGRKKALEEMNKVPADVPIPPGTINAIKKTLESLQAQAKGDNVEIGVFMPNEALRALPSMLLWRALAHELQPAQPPAKQGERPLPPPPVPAKGSGRAPDSGLAPLTMPTALVAFLHGKTQER